MKSNMHGPSITRLSTLAVLCISMGAYSYPFFTLAAALTLDNSVKWSAAIVTIDIYSLIPTTATSSLPQFTLPVTGAIASVVGVASVSVQADGETVYAETVVATQNAVVSGTSTLTSFSRAPTTTVCKIAAAVCLT